MKGFSYHDHDPHEIDYSADKHEPDLFLSSLPDEVWYETVQRDVVIRLFRACPVNEVTITRNGVERKYDHVREPRITQLQRIVRKHHIEIEVEFMYFTEISFSFDGERPVQS